MLVVQSQIRLPVVPNLSPGIPKVFTFLQTIASLTLCDYAFGDVVVQYILVFFVPALLSFIIVGFFVGVP